MAWEDLDSELAELFEEYSTNAEKVEAALYRKVQWQSAAAQAYLQEWRARNRAHINAYLADWRARNRDKVLAYRKAWRERHRDAIRAKGREEQRVRMQDPAFKERHRLRQREYMRAKRARAKESLCSQSC